MNGRTVEEDTVIAALYNSSKDLTYISIEKGGTQIYPSLTNKSINQIVKDDLSTGQVRYKERIVEVTTGGQYITEDDGTRITIKPGETKVYVYYKSVNN